MRKDREQSEEVMTKERLRQGGTRSPILFIIIMDDAAKEINSKIKQIHVRCKVLEIVSVRECVFADDLVVLTKNISELKCNLMLWKEAPRKRNMNINMEKLKL